MFSVANQLDLYLDNQTNFLSENHKILYLSDRHRHEVYGTKLSLYNEVLGRGFKVDFVDNVHGSGMNRINGRWLYDTIKKEKYTDVWIAHCWTRYVNTTLEELNSLGAYVLGFGFSDPVSWRDHKVGTFNAYATNDFEVSMQKCNGLPTLFFPTACDTTFHKRLQLEKTTDILIYGTGKHPNLVDNYRVKVATHLFEKFSHLNIQLYGQRWGTLPCNGILFGDAFIQEINKSKVCVDMTKPKAQLAHRIFECGACGVPVITRDNPEIRALLVPDKEVLLYSTLENLCEKITRLINDSVYREQLSDNVHHACTTKHNISNRVDMLLDFLGEERAKWRLERGSHEQKSKATNRNKV